MNELVQNRASGLVLGDSITLDLDGELQPVLEGDAPMYALSLTASGGELTLFRHDDSAQKLVLMTYGEDRRLVEIVRGRQVRVDEVLDNGERGGCICLDPPCPGDPYIHLEMRSKRGGIGNESLFLRFAAPQEP